MELFDLIYLPNWLLCTIAAISFWYLYITKNFGYWKARGIPEVAAYPIVGSFASVVLKAFHLEELSRYKKYGRLYGAFEGSNPVISVSDPDLLRDIFVKDFFHFTDRRGQQTGDVIGDNFVSSLNGEDWKRVRTLLTPAFTTGKLKRIFSIMKDCTITLNENLSKAARSKKSIIAKDLFGAFSMDVICTSAFATRIDSHNDPNNPIVSNAKQVFTRDASWRLVVWFLFPWFMKLFNIAISPPHVMQYFKQVVLSIIQERKKTGKAQNDFLQLMLDVEKESVKQDDDDGVEEELEKGNAEIFSKPMANKTLSNDEIVAQAVIFFIAGYDTSALTLSYLAYQLALNPDIQEKLIEEIDETVKDVKDVDYDKLSNMKYLDKVVTETLRFYPIASRLERRCVEDYKLGDTGITIPKGMVVTIPAYAIQHDPEHYPDPETFDPERFSPEQKANRHPFTYIPFGAGPRNCIGMRFALLEVKMCIVTVLKQFRFSTCAETQVPLDFYKGQNLLQHKRINLNVEIRNDIPGN